MHRQAFSLIELLFAMVGGLLVCLIAFAALRAAGKTWQRGMRIANENQLMTAGILYGLEDLDYWHSYNTLVDYNAGPGRIEPCNPLNFSHAAPFNDIHLPSGWYDLEYRADDPRWWFGGPDYPIDTTTGWRYGKWYLVGNRSDPPADVPMSDGRMAKLYAFSDRQILAKSLAARLGLFAFLEYMPANVVTGIIAKTSTGSYRYDREFWTGGSNTGSAPPTTPLAVDDPSRGSGFAWRFAALPMDQTGSIHNVLGVVNESSAMTMGGNRMNWQGRAVSNKWTAASYGLSAYRFHNDAVQFLHLLPRDGAGGVERPADLPELRVQTRHFVNYMRMYNVLNVRLVDPDTGVSKTLGIPATASTLRGARRQRAALPGSGHVATLEPGP